MGYLIRKKDREVTSYKRMLDIFDILRRCDCCRLGFSDDRGVYIVPLRFGLYEEGGKLILYFYSA